MPANGLPNKALVHKDQIIQRVANGERITDIARTLGYASHSMISGTLSNDPGYRQAIIDSAWAKLEQREEQMEQATEQTDITRQRELLSHARWMAERLNRDQFSPKPDISIQINQLVSLDQAVAGAASELLDRLRTVAETPKDANVALLRPVLRDQGGTDNT